MHQDFLRDLIGSMRSKEVVSFKASDHLSSGKWHRERTLLFHLYRSDEQDIAGKLRSSIGDSPYLKMLRKERFRMSWALMSHLRESEGQSRKDLDPWRPLEDARLLSDRGLPGPAAERALEGIQVAAEVHDLHAELVLREQLRSIYKLMPRGTLSEQITDNDYRLEMLARQVTNLTSYNHLSDRIFDLQNKYRIADDISVRSAMDALMQDELMADMKQANSLPAQIRFASIKAYHAQCTGQLEAATDHLHRAVALWESCAARIAYLPHLYRQTLANLIGLYTLIGHLDQVPLLLKRMEQIPVQGQRAEMLAFCDTELQYQLYCMNSGQLEAVAEREEQVIAGLNRFAGLVIESKELTLLYNLGITHLMLGQDKDALRYFNRIRDKGRLASRLDLQSTARIFRLLLLLENDDTANFHHYLRSNKRSFRSHMPTFNMMEAVYDWLDRNAIGYNSPKRNDMLIELQGIMVGFEQERVVGAEEIMLWTRSRMGGRKMIDLMREQKARPTTAG
jgi:tetratricopeptide (TPR) repeat protein